jgi:hypothetical protein
MCIADACVPFVVAFFAPSNPLTRLETTEPQIYLVAETKKDRVRIVTSQSVRGNETPKFTNAIEIG